MRVNNTLTTLFLWFSPSLLHSYINHCRNRTAENKKIKLSAVQSPRPYILLHCLTNSKINFSQHSHCERVVKTKESVLQFNVTRSSQSRFFPKVHRHCELPLKHYKQRGKKSNESLSFPSATCRPPHRSVCFVVYCYTNVHQYRKTFRFPLAQRAWHIRKTKKHTTWICCCCSTFVAMLCSGVNNLVF